LNRLARAYACASRLLLNPSYLKGEELKLCERIGGDALDDAVEMLREAYTAIAHRMSVDPLGLEELYISLFELAPRCPLYVTHYVSRDDRERVAKMLRISGIYRSKGYIVRGELPDFLPVILEFLSLVDDSRTRRELISFVLPGVRELRNCVQGFHPYDLVINSVAKLMSYEVGGG
jgi:nitrate reductase delta subunit